jgi:hypothetical protein
MKSPLSKKKISDKKLSSLYHNAFALTEASATLITLNTKTKSLEEAYEQAYSLEKEIYDLESKVLSQEKAYIYKWNSKEFEFELELGYALGEDVVLNFYSDRRKSLIPTSIISFKQENEMWSGKLFFPEEREITTNKKSLFEALESSLDYCCEHEQEMFLTPEFET